MDFPEDGLSDMADQLPVKDSVAQDLRRGRTKTTRRGGACEACKKSKTKCDGQIPCGACRSEKRKSRTCEYSDKARGIAASREDNESRMQRWTEESSGTDDSEHQDEGPPQHHNSTAETPAAKIISSWTTSSFMNKRISLCQVVEEFAVVKPSKSRALQNISRVRNQWREVQMLLARNDIQDHYSRPSLGEDGSQSVLHEPTLGSSMIDVWQSRLDAILAQINTGDLMGAWNKTSSLLRAIETWEMFASKTTGIPGSSFPPSEEFINQISSICLQLVELDCTIGFFLGGQSLLPAWDKSQFLRPKFEQCKLQDDNIASKIDLYTNIQKLLEVNVSDEAGIFDFLHLCHDIKSSDPATDLERMATCTTDSAPAEKQVLKLTSNLVFAVMYCRTASVCGHYSREECVVPALSGAPSDIIQQMRLHLPRQKGNECSQVVKHAGNALQAFEKLCEIDPEETARSWFRVHGALIAAVLIATAGLREKLKKGDWEAIKARLTQLESRLQTLSRLNPTCPIFGTGIQLLAECDQRKHSAPTAAIKSKHKIPLLKRSQSSSSSGTSVRDEDFINRVKPAQSGRPSRPAKRPVSNSASSRILKKRKLTLEMHHNFESDPRVTYAEHGSTMYPSNNPYFEEGRNMGTQAELDARTSFASSATSSFVEPVAPANPGWNSDLQHQMQMYEGTMAMHPPLILPEDWLQKWQPSYNYLDEPTAPVDVHYDSNPSALLTLDQHGGTYQSTCQSMHASQHSPFPGRNQVLPQGALSSSALAPHPAYDMAEAGQFFNSAARQFEENGAVIGNGINSINSINGVARAPSLAHGAVQHGQHASQTSSTTTRQLYESHARAEIFSADNRPYQPELEQSNLIRRASEPNYHLLHAEQYQYQRHNFPPHLYPYPQPGQNQEHTHQAPSTYTFQNHHCGQAARHHHEQRQGPYPPYNNVTKSC